MVPAGTQEEQRQAASDAAPLPSGPLSPAASYDDAGGDATALATFVAAVGGN